MKELFRFLSVPAAVIGLILMLAFSEGIADGSIPFGIGFLGGLLLIAVEFIAFNALTSRDGDDEKDEKNPDE